MWTNDDIAFLLLHRKNNYRIYLNFLSNFDFKKKSNVFLMFLKFCKQFKYYISNIK